MLIRILAGGLLCLAQAKAIAAETPSQAFAAACQRAQIQTGLAVHLGAKDLEIAAKLRDAGAAHVVAVVDDAGTAKKLRAKLAQQGRLGPIQVIERLDPKRVPLVDESALLIVAEEGEQSTAKETLRAVRPYGTLLRGGKATVKSWPAGYDGWYDYYYDAAGNELSNDAEAGPLVGLQWTAGDASTKGQVGFRLSGGILLTSEERGRPLDGGRGKWDYHCLVARDAFTGLILWERPDLKLQNTYAFDVAQQRVYLHPVGQAHQVSLDLKTGKTLITYTAGVSVDPETYTKRYHIPFWQSLLHQGTLIQVHGSQLIALEAATGQRLWAHDFRDEGLMPYVPIIADGKLVVVAGRRAEMSWSYNKGWRSMQLAELRAYDPASGKLAWRWREPSKMDLYVQNMNFRSGAIGMIYWAMPEGTKDRRRIARQDGHFGLLCFEPTGKLRWKTVVFDRLGAGHGSHYRCLIADGKLWVTNSNKMWGYDLKSGKKVADASAVIAPLCNVIRGTRDLLFHGAGAGSIKDLKYRSVTATRPSCDTGSYPAFGRLYVSQTNCGCTQFLPGTTAGLPRADTHELDGQRLFPGSAKAAPTAGGESGWPSYFADAERSLWVEERVRELAPVWQHQHADPLKTFDKVRRSDWKHNPWRSGPVTAPVAAEGVLVYVLTDSGILIARDADSGRLKWSRPLAGRIDSPPTIHRGLVICGTRAGWVYALNRDSGEVAWRFLAAPHQRQLVAQGAAESLWPASGAVTVVDDTVWLCAGRSMETDGGLWIWGLNAATGEVKHQARLDGTMDWKPTSERVAKHRSYNLGQPFIYDRPNKLLLLYEAAVRSTNGEVYTSVQNDVLHVPHGGAPPNRLKRSNIRTLVYNGLDEQGKYGVGMMYAGVKAKLMAHRGDQMVTLLDNGGAGGRGGGAKHGSAALWKIGSKPVERRSPRLGDKVWEIDRGSDVIRRQRDDWFEYQVLAVAGDSVLLNHGKTLHVLDLESGKPRSGVQLPELPVFAGIAVADGCVYVTCRDGTVICLK